MLPDGWLKSNIADACFEIIDCEHKTAPYIEQSDYLVVRTSNVKNGVLNFTDIKCTTLEAFQEWTQRTIPIEGDIFFTREAPAGESCLVPKNYNVCMGQRMVLLRSDIKKTNAKFLAAYLSSYTALTEIKKISLGSTVTRINIQDIKKIQCLLPPLPEQQKIAQILSTWDKAIEKLEALITAKKKRKKALMQQLLTGKKRFSGFREPWKYLKANKLFKTISKKKNSDTEKLLSVTQDQGVLPRELLERRVVMPEGSTKNYKLVVSGNFIISLRSFQGGLEYSNYQGLVSPAYTILSSIIEISNDFYRHYFKSYDFIGHLAVAVIGIRDGKQISYNDFSFLKLPFPEIKEQQKIASVLSTADKETDTHQKQLEAFKQQKKGLMQQLLTGKKRVKPDNGKPHV